MATTSNLSSSSRAKPRPSQTPPHRPRRQRQSRRHRSPRQRPSRPPSPPQPSQSPRTRPMRSRPIVSSRTARATSRSKCWSVNASAVRTGKPVRSRPRPSTRSCSANWMRPSAARPPRHRSHKRHHSRRRIPATNPQGWAQHVVQQQQAALLNERLNNSEMMLADKIGAEKLNGVRRRVPQPGQRGPDAVRQALQPAAPLCVADPRGRPAAPGARCR